MNKLKEYFIKINIKKNNVDKIIYYLINGDSKTESYIVSRSAYLTFENLMTLFHYIKNDRNKKILISKNISNLSADQIINILKRKDVINNKYLYESICLTFINKFSSSQLNVYLNHLDKDSWQSDKLVKLLLNASNLSLETCFVFAKKLDYNVNEISNLILEQLQDIIICHNDIKYAYFFLKDIKNINKDKLINLILKSNDEEYIIKTGIYVDNDIIKQKYSSDISAIINSFDISLYEKNKLLQDYHLKFCDDKQNESIKINKDKV